MLIFTCFVWLFVIIFKIGMHESITIILIYEFCHKISSSCPISLHSLLHLRGPSIPSKKTSPIESSIIIEHEISFLTFLYMQNINGDGKRFQEKFSLSSKKYRLTNSHQRWSIGLLNFGFRPRRFIVDLSIQHTKCCEFDSLSEHRKQKIGSIFHILLVSCHHQTITAFTRHTIRSGGSQEHDEK